MFIRADKTLVGQISHFIISMFFFLKVDTACTFLFTKLKKKVTMCIISDDARDDEEQNTICSYWMAIFFTLKMSIHDLKHKIVHDRGDL